MTSGWYQTDWGCLRVTGSDRVKWLNGMVTCDVTKTDRGLSVWGVLLSKQGKVQTEFQLLSLADEIYMGVSGGDQQSTLETLDGHLVMEDAEIAPADLAFCWILGDHALHEVARIGLSGSTSDMFAMPAQLCALSPSQLTTLKSDAHLSQLSESEFEEIRIRSGVPRYGVDYDSADNLHAAGLERKVVDWSKGCYLGQEVVCMQEMRGKVRQRLVQLVAPGPHHLAPSAPIKNLAGEEVGRVTSCFGQYGLAKVRSPENSAGTELIAAGRNALDQMVVRVS